MGTLKWYALLNNTNTSGDNRPEPFCRPADGHRPADGRRPTPATPLLTECTARVITLAAQLPESAAYITAHRLEDYRKRGTAIVMLPDISLPVDGILRKEASDELILF